ncbi:MAG: hypothetical protein IPJ86_05465 [Bacteroidetes bacterium]|nr:hypothetical protein [Bacteroidota bacterium]
MRSISSQFRKVTPVLLISWLLTTLALLLAIFISTAKDISLDSFYRTRMLNFFAPFYIGFFSNVGIMIWSAAVTICFYGMANRWKCKCKTQQFLLFSGIITLLIPDDLFQLHELVFPLILIFQII